MLFRSSMTDIPLSKRLALLNNDESAEESSAEPLSMMGTPGRGDDEDLDVDTPMTRTMSRKVSSGHKPGSNLTLRDQEKVKLILLFSSIRYHN